MIFHRIQIGNADVRLAASAELQSVCRALLDVAVPEKLPIVGPPVDLSVERVDTADWVMGIDAGVDCYRKGLDTHSTTVWHRERRCAIRLVNPISDVALYLAYRDLFCFLAGVQGDPLIHASCVIKDRFAYVFMAESGGGKSTIAEMLRDRADWVNDEIVWGLKVDGKYQILNQGLWRGEQPVFDLATAPIRKVYLIEKGSVCSEAPIGSAEIYAMLLGAPYGGEDPHLGTRAESTANLAGQVDAYRLSVPLDANAVAKVVFS